MTTNGTKNGNKITIVATVSVSTIISLTGLLLLLLRDDNEKLIKCVVAQASVQQEVLWEDYARVLEGLDNQDSVSVQFYLDKINGNPSLQDRIEDNC